jgi:hypothetical protein
MRAFSCIALLVLAFAGCGYVRADAPPFPGALRCEFESYTSAVAEKPDKSIRATVRAEPGIDPLIYTAFDAANGSAQLIGNVGASGDLDSNGHNVVVR